MLPGVMLNLFGTKQDLMQYAEHAEKNAAKIDREIAAVLSEKFVSTSPEGCEQLSENDGEYQTVDKGENDPEQVDRLIHQRNQLLEEAIAYRTYLLLIDQHLDQIKADTIKQNVSAIATNHYRRLTIPCEQPAGGQNVYRADISLVETITQDISSGDTGIFQELLLEAGNSSRPILQEIISQIENNKFNELYISDNSSFTDDEFIERLAEKIANEMDDETSRSRDNLVQFIKLYLMNLLVIFTIEELRKHMSEDMAESLFQELQHLVRRYNRPMPLREPEMDSNQIKRTFKIVLKITPYSSRIHKLYADFLNPSSTPFDNHSSENLEEAIAKYESAIDCDPGFIEAYSAYASLLVSDDRLMEAERTYQKGIEHNPENASLRRSFAEFLAEHGEPDDAKQQYQKGIEYDPEDIRIRRSFAEFLAEHGEPDKAEHQYQRAVEIDPSNRATISKFINFLSKLIGEIRTSQKLDQISSEYPTEEVIYKEIIEFCENVEHADPKRWYERAIQNIPESEDLTWNYGKHLWDTENFEAAIKACERSLNINSSAYKHNTLAEWLVEEGYIDEAKKHYKQSVELAPENAQYHNNYAVLLEHEFNQYEKAKKHYKQAVELDPENAQYHNNYAALLEHEFNRYRKAKKHYKRAVKLAPENAQYHHDYARLLKNEFNRYRKAKKHYKRAVELAPENAQYHNNYAVLLEHEFNQYRKAKKHYKRAVKLAPENALYHNNYAVLLEDEFNRYRKAKKHYKRAVKLAPENAQYHHDYAINLRHLNYNYKSKIHMRKSERLS